MALTQQQVGKEFRHVRQLIFGGATQKDLEPAYGVDRSVISRLEHGRIIGADCLITGKAEDRLGMGEQPFLELLHKTLAHGLDLCEHESPDLLDWKNDFRRTIQKYFSKQVRAPLPDAYPTGDAYLLVNVEPGTSDTIAKEISKLPGVKYAAAVLGQWDVIARVTLPSFPALLGFIKIVRGLGVGRTETWCIRNDPEQVPFEIGRDSLNFAFVMLRVASNSEPGLVLERLIRLFGNRRPGELIHAAGILGPWDIALTVLYDNEKQLAELVMDHDSGIQSIRQIQSTLTIPTIKLMSYPKRE